MEAASRRQGSVVARRSSAQALKALSSKLLDEKAQLQRQQVENEAKAKEIAAEHVKWDAEKKKQEDMVRCAWGPLNSKDSPWVNLWSGPNRAGKSHMAARGKLGAGMWSLPCL